MKQKTRNALKFGLGLAVSIFFLYLAFQQVDLQKLSEVLRSANIMILILATLVMFLSHWFRAVRHRHLLEPMKQIKNSSLFSALMIGYMANTFLPAHLGEFLRAYIIGKKETITGSSAFATIVVERILDVIFLLVIMGFVFVSYPFPDIIKLSAYITFAFVLGLMSILTLFKLKPTFTLGLVQAIMKPFPRRIGEKVVEIVKSFNEGVVSLKEKTSYLHVFVLSALVWGCYAATFYIGFYAFDFVNLYNLPFGASLVVLVITTISVVVPSSPGYVGTYHWLCMISLSLFNIPESSALGYAIVLHAISMVPVALVGLAFALKEGINIFGISEQLELKETTVGD